MLYHKQLYSIAWYSLHQDYKKLYEDLHELAPKWQTFGVHLGVPFDRLQGFQGEASMVDRCFTNVLATWLQGGGGDCTVDQLVYALKMPGVDQGRLAREIDKNKAGKCTESLLHDV